MFLSWVVFVAPHVCRRAVVRALTTPQCLLLGLLLSLCLEIGAVLLLIRWEVLS